MRRELPAGSRSAGADHQERSGHAPLPRVPGERQALQDRGRQRPRARLQRLLDLPRAPTLPYLVVR